MKNKNMKQMVRYLGGLVWIVALTGTIAAIVGSSCAENKNTDKKTDNKSDQTGAVKMILRTARQMI